MNVGIAIFVYNRIEHTKKMLDSLSHADDFELYDIFIFSDAPRQGSEKTVSELRSYIKSFIKKYPNIKLLEAEENRGCKGNIQFGIDYIFERYDAVISIEDDVVISPVFLRYMQLMLEKYRDDQKVGEITGYKYPDILFKIPFFYQYDIFFVPRTSSWGWATWKDRWNNIDWDLKDLENFKRDFVKQKDFNQGGDDLTAMLLGEAEWDLIWAYHNFKYNRFTAYPVKSYVDNIGLDGSGVHCGAEDNSVWGFKDLNITLPQKFPSDTYVDKRILRNFRKIFSKGLYSKIRGIKKRIFRAYKLIFNK